MKKVSSQHSYKKREKWDAMIREWEAGDLSQAAFCREKNLNKGSFTYWRKQLAAGDIRKKSKDKKWRDILCQWRKSRLSPAAFCQQQKINLATFMYQRSLLEGEAPPLKAKKNREKWDGIFQAWQASGLSQTAFCKKMNLSFQTFSYQKKRSPQWKLKNFPLQRTEEKWEDLVNLWKKSGLSKAKFCRDHHVDERTFSRWARRYDPDQATGQNLVKQKQWDSLLKEWQASGLSQAEFCRHKKIGKESFAYWKSILCPEDKRRSLKEEKYWHPILETWKTSGLSASQFCRNHGLDAQKLRYWKRLLLPKEPLERKHQWEKRLHEWSESGLTIKAYCESKGLTPRVFLYWKKKYGPKAL